MKISREGPLPQVELGPTLGGFKRLYQRSGIVARLITMLSAMSAAWSTTPTLQQIFGGSFVLFAASAAGVLICWMIFDYVALLPSEQSFNQGQSQRAERSPLKRDTEEIREHLSEIERRTKPMTDGGDCDDGR